MAPANAAAARPAMPPWVQAAREVEAPADPDATGVVLWSKTHYRYHVDGYYQHTQRSVLRLAGQLSFPRAVATVPYVEGISSPPKLRAWIVYPDGAVKNYGPDAFRDALAYRGAITSRHRRLSLSAVADARSGAVFAWEATRVVQPDSLQQRWT